jgi:hypothetical protein
MNWLIGRIMPATDRRRKIFRFMKQKSMDDARIFKPSGPGALLMCAQLTVLVFAPIEFYG